MMGGADSAQAEEARNDSQLVTLKPRWSIRKTPFPARITYQRAFARLGMDAS